MLDAICHTFGNPVLTWVLVSCFCVILSSQQIEKRTLHTLEHLPAVAVHIHSAFRGCFGRGDASMPASGGFWQWSWLCGYASNVTWLQRLAGLLQMKKIKQDKDELSNLHAEKEIQSQSSPMRVRVWRDVTSLEWLQWLTWRVFVSWSSSGYH